MRSGPPPVRYEADDRVARRGLSGCRVITATTAPAISGRRQVGRPRAAVAAGARALGTRQAGLVFRRGTLALRIESLGELAIW